MNFAHQKPRATIMTITPDVARAMIKTSPGNRHLRVKHVSALAGAMARGEWRVTSQGVGFDHLGRLRDAHHRLHACIESGVAIESMVVFGMRKEAYGVIDTGINRSYADRLGESRGVAEILRLGCSILLGTSQPVVGQMSPIIDAGLRDAARALVDFCPTRRTYYSSASMRLAACITLMYGGDPDYVLQQYHALCNLNFDQMSNSAQALFRQVESGKAKASEVRETMARGLRVFDQERSHVTKIQIGDADMKTAADLVRFVLRKSMQESEAVASSSVSLFQPRKTDPAKTVKFLSHHPSARVMEITPALAEEMLATSAGNRAMRKWYVNLLAATMRRGEWQVTSQGIGFDRQGRLRDAHHRLSACVQSGVPIQSVVVLGMREDAYEVTDTGLARDYGTLLDLPTAIADVIRIGCQFALNNAKPTVDQIIPYIEAGLGEKASTLIDACGAKCKFYASAPMKLAACITMMNGGDPDYVLRQYRALCLLDFSEMSPSAQALVRQVQSGKAKATQTRETLARGFRVFDEDRRDVTKIQVSEADADASVALVRSVLRNSIIKHQGGKARSKPEVSDVDVAA